jgi:L-2-hydroxyglutarate oxidase LhgO
MRMESVECVVVGAGVIGLAIARRLALAGCEVILLEEAEAIGTGISSRNSEVIHAGIYYKQQSLMATSCVAGKQALYEYCREKGIAHAACGKLIVATTADELTQLSAMAQRAAANGVHDLRNLTASEAISIEPALNCTGALLSPSTCIIDSHGYMLALRGDFEAMGGVIAFHTPVMAVRPAGNGLALTTGGLSPYELTCRTLINAAGLGAIALAGRIAGIKQGTVPRAYLAKGSYFTVSGRAPFSRLIYPVPVAGGLGVHLTLDLAGQARFGPDVEWVEEIDFRVDPGRAERFASAIKRYWPGLPEEALTPAYAGIRPKIVPPEVAVQDFVIQGVQKHGVAGLINLFGIESPGLTASLALADIVARMVAGG